jgi:hypothetical protein
MLRTRLLLASCALLVVSSLGVAAQSSDTFFAVSGDVTVTVEEATAVMTKIRDQIPAITITSAPASIRELGSSYSVNLFFSEDFSPEPGEYPIEFSYRRQVNTLGGSFRGDGTTFSHDTKGTAEFIEFGEQVKVRFEFETFDQSEGSEGRRRVTVKGEVVCARADIF